MLFFIFHAVVFIAALFGMLLIGVLLQLLVVLTISPIIKRMT